MKKAISLGFLAVIVTLLSCSPYFGLINPIDGTWECDLPPASGYENHYSFTFYTDGTYYEGWALNGSMATEVLGNYDYSKTSVTLTPTRILRASIDYCISPTVVGESCVVAYAVAGDVMTMQYDGGSSTLTKVK